MGALTSRILDSQVIGKQLLFRVDLAPGATRRYLLRPAAAVAAVPPADVKTHARLVPERLDDYKVGPARGCGGSGIWDGKKLAVLSNYKSWKDRALGGWRPICPG